MIGKQPNLTKWTARQYLWAQQSIFWHTSSLRDENFARSPQCPSRQLFYVESVPEASSLRFGRVLMLRLLSFSVLPVDQHAVLVDSPEAPRGLPLAFDYCSRSRRLSGLAFGGTFLSAQNQVLHLLAMVLFRDPVRLLLWVSYRSGMVKNDREEWRLLKDKLKSNFRPLQSSRDKVLDGAFAKATLAWIVHVSTTQTKYRLRLTSKSHPPFDC